MSNEEAIRALLRPRRGRPRTDKQRDLDVYFKLKPLLDAGYTWRDLDGMKIEGLPTVGIGSRYPSYKRGEAVVEFYRDWVEQYRDRLFQAYRHLALLNVTDNWRI